MQPKLFMLEVLVNRISFEPDYEKIPELSDIIIRVTCNNLLQMYINPNDFTEVINKRDDRCWGLNIGKSCIFIYNFQSLRAELQRYPLEIILQLTNKKALGKAVVPWKKEFIEMLNIFQQIGVVKSVDYSNATDIISKDVKIGSIHFFIRMGCGADGLESDFRLRNDVDDHAWILIHSKTMKSVLCEGYDPEKNDIIPVARLYNSSLTPPNIDAIDFSWLDIPRATKPTLDEFGIFQLFAGASKSDVVSVYFEPNKNILDFLTSESQKQRKIRKDKRKQKESLTIDDIRSKLCSYCDCPGVKKFQDLGIDNTPTRTNLLGLQPPTDNFLTHIGRYSDVYSPQSIFMPPKHPNVPFSSPRSAPVVSPSRVFPFEKPEKNYAQSIRTNNNCGCALSRRKGKRDTR